MPDERQNRTEDEDDRVIANMNIEGMPWYNAQEAKPKNPNAEPMSTRNLWRYALSAVGAGLLIVMAFGLFGALFIWFCTNVWLK